MAVSAQASAFARSLGYAVPKPKPMKPYNPSLQPGFGAAHGVPVAPNVNPAALAPPAPVAAVAPAAPPPPDFNALTLTDPQYTTGLNDLQTQNTLTLDRLLKGFQQAGQGSQDSFNAHGGLFSGAAVNAQRNLAQQYEGQQAQQALNMSTGQHQLYSSVFDRLLRQLAGFDLKDGS